MINRARMDRPTYHWPVSRPGFAAMPPRIGLTTYREPAAWGVWDEPADLLPTSYAASIDAAGGVALLLPPATVDGAAGAALDGLHGLVLAGGADVDPARYAAERDARTGASRPDRDAWEIRLAQVALNRGMPLLAICRGMQVLNVALGGDLVQHLPDLVGHDEHCPIVGEHGRHEVTFADASRVGGMLGTGATVATYHHQAVRHIAADLVPVGWAADGTTEALEHAEAQWVVAVQWHPEVHDGAPLFDGLLAASASYRAGLSASR